MTFDSTFTTTNNNNNNSLCKKICVAGAIALFMGVASQQSPTKAWLRSESSHSVNAEALSAYSGTGEPIKATIGVSVYFTQRGVNAGLAVLGHSGIHGFSHMGVYYIPGTLGGETKSYLTGQTNVKPTTFFPTKYHGDVTCDQTDRWPKFMEYDTESLVNLDGKGFEVTYSDGPSATDFTKYKQTIAVGSPGRYIRGSSTSAIWHGAADISISAPTDLSARDFYLAADTVARSMNEAGGYGPANSCQEFSTKLLAELSAPFSMIQETHKYQLSKYDIDFLRTGCAVSALTIPIVMCAGMGYHRWSKFSIPPKCSEKNNNYNKVALPQYGNVDKTTNPTSCWKDGKQCVNHATCGNCCNSYYFPGTGIKPFCGPKGKSCWEKGTVCFNGISCGACCNGSHGWFAYHVCK